MAEKIAQKALRKLHKHVKDLDPSVLDSLYAEGLIMQREKERIDAAGERTKKAELILDSLANRDAKRAMDGLIEALEEDEEANEKFLRRIAEVYPHYKGKQVEEPTLEIDRGKPTDTGSARTMLPAISLPGKSSAPAEKCLVPITSVTTRVEEATDGRRTRYSMTSSPHGYCIVINNVNFATMKSRSGSEWDADALFSLFSRFMDFHTQRFNDLSSRDILAILRNIQEQDHSRLDCLVVAILSHGVNGQIYGTDGVLLSVEELMTNFKGTRCPSLAGKPKVFILQACRGGKFDSGVMVEATDSAGEKETIDEDEILAEDETDGGGYNTALPDESDFVLAYATTPGYVSWRNSAFGTWFIKALTDTMYELAATEHLMDILTEVNRKVAEEYQSRGKQKQMPAPVSMLRYKLYIPPFPGARRLT